MTGFVRQRKCALAYVLPIVCGLLFNLLSVVLFIAVAENKPAKKVGKPSKPLYELTKGRSVLAIEAPLFGKRGWVGSGKSVFLSPSKGNCLACHRLRQFEKYIKDQPDIYGSMGDIGPELDGLNKNYQPQELRLILVDAKKAFPDTVMPAYFKTENIHRPLKATAGTPLLTAQEIEDLLAFLKTLK